MPEIALVCLVFIAALAAIVPLGNVPQNDDWVYAIAVRALLTTGRYTMPSPSSANAVAQIYWGALFCIPFGFSFEALRASTMVLAVAGVAATYALMRECGMDRRTAAVVTGCVGLNPIVLALSISFMTDMPFLALSTVAIWLHVRGAMRQDRVAAVAAVLVALLAMLVRQFAVALLLGFAVSIVMRRGFRVGPIMAGAAIVAAGLALHFSFTTWMIATGRTPVVVVTIGALLTGTLFGFVQRIVHLGAMAWMGVGFMVLPVMLAVSGGRIAAIVGWSSSARAWIATGIMAALCIATLAANGEGMPVPHGTLYSYGIGPLLLRDVHLLHDNVRPVPAIVTAGWWVVTVVAAWAGAILLLGLARSLLGIGRAVLRAQMADHWLEGLMLAIAGTIVATTMLSGWIAIYADRYNLILIAPLAILLWRLAPLPAPGRAWATPSAVAIIAFAGAFGIASTHDLLAWQRVRWQVSDDLLASGVKPEQIDGGYEFNGWLLSLKPRVPAPPGVSRSYWWVTDDEYIIGMGPLPGYAVVSTTLVSTWLPFGATQICVLHREPNRP